MVKRFLRQAESDDFNDQVHKKLIAFLRVKKDVIWGLISLAEKHAQTLRTQSQEYILCHSDIHAGNILIDANGDLYIVDWDNPILAPKERDLMFIGGGQGFRGYSIHEEETLFYEGYGQTQIDLVALAYYRYERIIQDTAVFCEHIFSCSGSGEDRKQSLRYLKSNFLPNRTLEIAFKADPAQQVK